MLKVDGRENRFFCSLNITHFEMASKRKALTLSERVDVIKEGEKGQSSRELAAKFGVGRTQIQCILKRKAEVMAEYESAASPSKRRNARPTGNEPINDTISNPTVSREEALTNLSILRTYFHHNCDIECLEHLQRIEKSLLKVKSTNAKQQSILQFLK